MDTIRVDREEALQILEQNREKHEKQYKKDIETWVKKSTKALAKAAKKAKEEGWIDRDVLSDLPKPQSYLNSYDSAIARLKADVRDEIELDDREFAAWYEDNWAWRGAFVATSSIYN